MASNNNLTKIASKTNNLAQNWNGIDPVNRRKNWIENWEQNKGKAWNNVGKLYYVRWTASCLTWMS